MRYDQIWSIQVTRALETADVSLDAFIATAKAAGMGEGAAAKRLLEDLETGGPIFGPFLRSLTGAAEGSTMAAERQGQFVGQVAEDKALSELLELSDLEDVIDRADPEEMAEIEELAEDQIAMRWVATMIKTCHRCLPLHGKVMTLGQWKEAGFLPETIHDGWNSACQCNLVPGEGGPSRDSLVSPLLRVKREGSDRRTERAVTQADLDRAMAARNKAMESLEGRRTLRLLGQAMDDET